MDKRYELIAELLNNHKPIATYIEQNAIGEPIYNEIKKLLKHKETFHKWLTTNDSKKDIINQLQVLIANKDITFNEDNDMLKSQLGTYSYKLTKNGNITFNAMSGFKDDAIMSLAMAIKAKEDFKTTNNISFIKKNILKQMR